MKSSLLPLCPRLLRDEDPIPLYALKLLGGAVEADEGAVSAVAALGLAPAFFEFLSLEHTNNNVHNVRLCLALASSDAVPVEKLREYGAGGKVAAVLRYAHENAVEPFLEPALEMCRAVLRRAFRAKGEDGGRGGEALGAALECAAPLVELAPTLLERACVSESDGLSGGGAPRLAAEALALATELLPEETGAAVFRPDARLAERVDAMGTVAALANDQRGFAELGSVPGWSAVSRSYERRGARDAEDGEASPRRCAASAQRIALEAVSAASRAPGLTLGREDAHVVDAEAALRRLARGEPNRCLADAAAEAADGVRRLLARRAAR
jgi:serine/threonine-protein kinase ULK4